MHARMTRLQASPERLDDMARLFREQTAPLLESLDGYRGHLLLADHSAGTALALTLWESEEAIDNWYDNHSHKAAQKMGRERMFKSFRISRVKVLKTMTMNWPGDRKSKS
jgi:heme-degrading monooxygenase HmoA